ncbi:mediator of RNA polymerase II transcription subunit [Striga asiatica]|uniref:Mediator of RNA polymerase II transcription subunit n=1 Tax=Striga asiatica TaxID=4170 RepID=A0A5A7R9G7_STRAF|nr:mediator of RNA polymerase II transcription subunit [Striga asiatica]
MFSEIHMAGTPFSGADRCRPKLNAIPSAILNTHSCRYRRPSSVRHPPPVFHRLQLYFTHQHAIGSRQPHQTTPIAGILLTFRRRPRLAYGARKSNFKFEH